MAIVSFKTKEDKGSNTLIWVLGAAALAAGVWYYFDQKKKKEAEKK